jgi:hypothetical protein
MAMLNVGILLDLAVEEQGIPAGVVVGIGIDDVDAFYQELVARGVTPEANQRAGPGEYAAFTSRTPIATRSSTSSSSPCCALNNAHAVLTKGHASAEGLLGEPSASGGQSGGGDGRGLCTAKNPEGVPAEATTLSGFSTQPELLPRKVGLPVGPQVVSRLLKVRVKVALESASDTVKRAIHIDKRSGIPIIAT